MMNDKCKSGVWESLLKHLHQDAERRSIDQYYSDSRSSTCRRRFEVQSKDAVFNDAQSGLREGLFRAMRQIRLPSIASRTLPIKKPRPETAAAVFVTRHIFEMLGEGRVHRVQFATHRRVCNRTL